MIAFLPTLLLQLLQSRHSAAAYHPSACRVEQAPPLHAPTTGGAALPSQQRASHTSASQHREQPAAQARIVRITVDQHRSRLRHLEGQRWTGGSVMHIHSMCLQASSCARAIITTITIIAALAAVAASCQLRQLMKVGGKQCSTTNRLAQVLQHLQWQTKVSVSVIHARRRAPPPTPNVPPRQWQAHQVLMCLAQPHPQSPTTGLLPAVVLGRRWIVSDTLQNNELEAHSTNLPCEECARFPPFHT